MKKLSGIGVSTGLACGKVLKLENPHFEISSKKIADSDINTELSEYKRAVELAETELQHVCKAVEKKLGHNEAEVFKAHIQILKDPLLSQKIINLIKNEHFNCPAAISKVYLETRDNFINMKNEYFRERAVDVEDVMNCVLSNLLNKPLPNLLLINEEVIIAAHELKPSQASMLDPKYVKGVAAETGGKTSHAAFIIQVANIPGVFGVSDLLANLKDGESMVIDGRKSEVYAQLNCDEQKQWSAKVEAYHAHQRELVKYASMAEVKTTDHHKIAVAANIGTAGDMDKIVSLGTRAVGLFRTEFLYINSANWPTEQEQYEAYKTVLMKAKGEPVIIRTLDIGGDKTLDYFHFEKEDNPFLGFRAIRFCLQNEPIFRTQLRALIRASHFGDLHIMFPMIATIPEVLSARKIFEDEYKKIASKTPVAKKIKLGIMIEIPAAAVLADEFAKHLDFLSIGTNDLIQYTLACDRTLKTVSYLYKDTNPSVLRLIKFVIDSSHKNKIWTGMCGGMASNPLLIPLLVGMGLDEFSMSGNSLLENKRIISLISRSECEALADRVLQLTTPDEVNDVLVEFARSKKLIVDE